MKIGINASFVRKPNSGMGQVSINFLRELTRRIREDEKFEDLEFILYLEEDARFDFSDFLGKFQKRIFLPKYKRDDLFRKIWWEKYLLPKKVKEDKCDFFVSLYQSTMTLKNVKHLMVVHDTIPEIFPEYLNNLRKKVYYKLVKKATQSADEIMAVSENSKKDTEKFYNIPKERIEVNYIDCDPIYKEEISEEKSNEVLKRYKLQKDEFILYVGGLDKRKNVDGLIQAFAEFWGRNEKENLPSPKLAIVGKFFPHLVPLMTDVPSEIKKIRKKHKIPKSAIKELGFVEQEDLPALYRSAKFFCFPSLYEGFGIMPLEAMNVGIAVITSKNSSLPEVVGKNSAFLIEDPKDTNEIAEAMLKLNEDEKLRERLVVNGKEQAKNFTWEKFVDVILKKVLESKE